MTTIPRIEEKPTRFGSPSSVLDVTPWEQLKANTFECRVVICPEPCGGFSAHATRLRGVASQGDSVSDALRNIAEAFRGAIAVYQENDGGVPWEPEPIAFDRPVGSLERWILVDV